MKNMIWILIIGIFIFTAPVVLALPSKICYPLATGAFCFNSTSITGFTLVGSNLDSIFPSNGLLRRTAPGVYDSINDNSTNWNTAFGWGNHASAGYLVATAATCVGNETSKFNGTRFVCVNVTGTGGSGGSVNLTTVESKGGNLTLNWSNGQSFTTQNLTGPIGATGATGSTGSSGSNGAAGTNGTNGLNGTRWNVTGLTLNATNPFLNPIVGDLGLLNTTGLVYQWNGTTWLPLANLTGPTGAQGVTGNTGATGSPGASYNVSNVTFAGGVINITWQNGASFIGPNLTGPVGATGATGTAGTNGTNGAAGANGVNGTRINVTGLLPNTTYPYPIPGMGDLVLYNVTYLLYQWNGTSFNVVGNLTGQAGPQGLTGNTGATGAAGTTHNITNVTYAGGVINITWTNGQSFIGANLTGPIGATGNTGATGTAGTNGTNAVIGASMGGWTNTSTNTSTSLLVFVNSNVTASNFFGNINASYVQNPYWLALATYQTENTTLWAIINGLITNDTTIFSRQSSDNTTLGTKINNVNTSANILSMLKGQILNVSNLTLAANCADGEVLKWSGGVGKCGTDTSGGVANVSASGATVGTIPRFFNGTTINDSIIVQAGNTITIGNATPALDISNNGTHTILNITAGSVNYTFYFKGEVKLSGTNGIASGTILCLKSDETIGHCTVAVVGVGCTCV